MSLTVERLPQSQTAVAPLSAPAVGAVDDPLERAADEIADRVMAARSASPVSVPRWSAGGDDVRTARHRDVSRSIASFSGAERPLSMSERAFFEPRFGYDFSSVRLHTGSAAASIAGDLNARAFTSGRHIAFEHGGLEPGTHRGMRLLGHELAHVVQQGAARPKDGRSTSPSGAAPALQLQTNGQPCAQQDIVDSAFDRARLLGGLALLRVKRVIEASRDLGFAQPVDDDVATHRSAVTDTFGDATLSTLGRIERELQGIQGKLTSRPAQLCAPASAPGCTRGFIAFVADDVADTIFYCPTFFEPAQTGDERALKTLHEVAHVLGKRHGGLDTDDETAIHACGTGLGISVDDALDNAYAYETLVGCLTGTRARATGEDALTRKEMRRVKKDLEQEP